jgi:hypothetical protein
MAPFAFRPVGILVALILLLTACQSPASVGSSPSQAVNPSDRITLPPTSREFTSPSGKFVFVVSTKDSWKSRRATGELFSAGSNRMLLWSRELPQEFGPRFALVNDQGTLLMLDEWINVNTQYAILVVDRDNKQVAQHSTDAVQLTLQVPMNQVVQMAAHGWWIQAAPTLVPTGDTALVRTAGKLLAIGLDTGVLSLR